MSAAADGGNEVAGVDPGVAQVANVRTPRVFRVDPSIANPGGEDAAVSAGDDPLKDDIDALPAIPSRRPRRRASPAVVTRVAAGVSNELAGGDDGAVSSELVTEQRFDDLIQRIRGLEPVIIQIRQARDLEFTRPPSRPGRSSRRHYLALRASLDKLKKQAEIVRRAEASRAVKWIRRALAEYGLSAADIGL